MKCQTRTIKPITMENIIILHAEDNNQHCIICDKAYEFEFSVSDLAKIIKKSCTSNELAEQSGLDCADYNDTEMSNLIAHYWLHSDVELLIQDFIDNTPELLIDHLQITKN